MGAINGDNRLPGQQFGLPTGGWYDSGAPGMQGDTAAETAGPVVGSPAVSSLFVSSQAVAAPRVDVMAGDTSAMSSDTPVGDSFPVIAGQPVAPMTGTGAGQGNPNPYRHPDNGTGTGA